MYRPCIGSDSSGEDQDAVLPHVTAHFITLPFDLLVPETCQERGPHVEIQILHPRIPSRSVSGCFQGSSKSSPAVFQASGRKLLTYHRRSANTPAALICAKPTITTVQGELHWLIPHPSSLVDPYGATFFIGRVSTLGMWLGP